MLIQSLVLIAALVVISGTILTSTLVSAKNGFHHAMMTATQTAMTDATADFVAWAASYVQARSAQTQWPRAFTTEFKPACSVAGSPLASPAPCQYYTYARWIVTGATTVGGAAATPHSNHVSSVTNLAPTLDEQRISATIVTDIDDPTGKRSFASASREVTARIFDAAPYVVITGTRDIGSLSGGFTASEGDSGGYVNPNRGASQSRPTPDPNAPANATDTRIFTSIDCYNTPGTSQSKPFTDVAHTVDHSIRPYGNQDWAFEAPCIPTNPPAPPPGLFGYMAPVGLTYDTAINNPSLNPWNKSDADASSFAR